MIPINELIERIHAAQHAADLFTKRTGNKRPSQQIEMAISFVSAGRPDMVKGPLEAAEREMRREELLPYVMRLPRELIAEALRGLKDANFDAVENTIIDEGLLG